VSALEKHLQETGSHEHLTFHRGCPVCRESRLAGRVVQHPLVPERMRDGVAVAAVVASAVATSARSAAEEEPRALPAPPAPEPVAPEPVVRLVPDEVVAGLGDTLWTIAADQLGGRSSSAAIAGEVNRLWMLNADRIGSGEPQLIEPGQRLRVR
jgi:hypothetical protein